MWTWTDLIQAAIPLFVLPWLLGAALMGPTVAGPVRWWVAALGSGLYFAVAHALGVSFGLAGTSYLVVVGAALLVGRRRVVSVHRALAWPRGHVQWVRASIWTVLLASMCAFVLAHPVSRWDAVVIWFSKTRALYEGVAFTELPFRNYPNLGPTLWTLVMKCLGSRAEEVGRLVLAVLYVTWALALPGVWTGERRRVAGGVALAVAFALLSKSAMGGYQDDFLMACGGMAALHFVRLTRAGTNYRSDRFLAFFFTGCLVFVKNEGAILALILVVCWFVAVVVRGGLSTGKATFVRVWPMLLMGIGLLALWPVLLAMSGIPPEEVQQKAFTLDSLLGSVGRLDRLGMILPYVGAYLVDHLGLLLASGVATVGAWRVDAKTRTPLVFLWGVWALHIAFIVVVYLSTRQDLAWHLVSAFNRLAAQHAFVYALVLCIGVPVLFERRRASRDARSDQP